MLNIFFRFKECVDTTEAVIDVTWEELNTGHWSLVPECQRRVYAASSLLKVLISFIKYEFGARPLSTLDPSDVNLIFDNSLFTRLFVQIHLFISEFNISASKLILT